MPRYKNVHLFVIDGQNDFCNSGNEPANYPVPAGGQRKGALYVDGADQEAENLASFIKETATGSQTNLIKQVHATLDSHHENDCAHNTTWKDQNGNTPDPFTIVSEESVQKHEFTPVFQTGIWEGQIISPHQWALGYTKRLKEEGRNPLTLWPQHCLIQGWGASIYHPLQEAYSAWTSKTGGWIDFITKGQWPFTEHYSPWRADVIDSTRPETQLNAGTLSQAGNCDLAIWSGWAGSHCLKWDGVDGVGFFEPDQADKDKGAVNEFVKKCVFVSDASAPVPNPPFPNAPDFAQWRVDFLNDMSNRGAQVLTLNETLRLLAS